MNRHLCTLGTGLGFALFPLMAAAAPEEVLDTIWRLGTYSVMVLVVVVVVGVYFFRSRDRRRTPLLKILPDSAAVHSVAPDTPVIEGVRKMAAAKIGALIVVEGDKLVGIFTERDALNKVLAHGLDPAATKMSAVMTKDPYSVSRTTTVAEAMEMVTQRRFRHLPVVENGKVLAVVSSRDLTHWLVNDEGEDIQELVDVAAGA